MNPACLTLLILVFSTVPVAAQNKTPASRPSVPQATAAQASIPNQRQQERIAQKFAEQHHPELAALLSHLKEMDEPKYTAAINELFRTHERLLRYQERSPERYQIELELWKIDSRVRLLVARSASGMEEETRTQIKQLLVQRNELRMQQLSSERDRLEDRLQRLNSQIKDLQNDSDVIAERDLERLMRSAQTRANSGRKKSAERKTLPAAVRNSPEKTGKPVRKDPQ